eukprot:365395-Chlamydomonas_euryale.AAC.2
MQLYRRNFVSEDSTSLPPMRSVRHIHTHSLPRHLASAAARPFAAATRPPRRAAQCAASAAAPRPAGTTQRGGAGGVGGGRAARSRESPLFGVMGVEGLECGRGADDGGMKN